MMKNYFSKSLRFKKHVTIQLLCLIIALPAFAQKIKGKVSDSKNVPLVGATVVVKGSTKGTQTDLNGNFEINELPHGQSTLVVSFIGYLKKEVNVSVPQGKEINVILENDDSSLDELIVTGVFDQRKQLEASVSITTIDAKQLKTLAPVSAADLLKNVPGVYVNSSAGEVDNQITVRGTPTNNRIGSENMSGYYYVAMLEDGMPVANLTGNGLGPDFYLRADVNVKRIEAVRGGSASITGSDAPGGMFNYVSKEGGTDFGLTTILKYGLEGNANPYYRGDLGFGGPINAKKDLTYYVGGFYRQSYGARNPGFLVNDGGQVRANIVKNIKGGKIKLYSKYINDKNGRFDFLPYTDYNHPKIAPGFKNTDTFLGPGDSKFDFKFQKDGEFSTFNPKDQIHNTEKNVGLLLEESFGNGWKISNNAKYSVKFSKWNTQYVNGVGTTNDAGTSGIWTNIGFRSSGTILVKNIWTGEELYKGTMSPTGEYTTIFDKMPNNRFIQGAGNAHHFDLNEFMDQFTVHKQIGKTQLTAGVYYGKSKIDFHSGFAGQYMSTFENRPAPIDVTVTAANGAVNQYTNNFGYKNNGLFYAHHDVNNTRLDLFIGQSCTIGE